MGLSAKFALRVVALALGAGASVWVADRAADMVEQRSHDSLRAALDAAGHEWTTVTVDGLAAQLGGEAPDEAARFRALRVAGTVVNPANLRDAMTVSPPEALPQPEFRLEILRRGSEVTVLGLLPGGVAPQLGLVQRLSALEGVTNVTDLLAVSPDAAPESWDATLDAALAVLAALPDGRMEMTTETLSISGLASGRAQVTEIADALSATVPASVVLTTDLAAPPPLVSPFVARFRRDAAGARFDACSASSADGRDRIEAAARRAGAPDDVRCFQALGAPDPAWDRAVVLGVEAVRDIGTGTLTVTDLSITLTPGADTDPAAFGNALAALEITLPQAFTLTSGSPSHSGRDAGTRPVSAEFSATLSPEGTAIIRGATASLSARDIVEGVARAHFSDDQLRLSLHRQSELPEGWSVRVLAGLDAFAALDSGRLSITPEMLSLTGRTGDPALSTTLASNLADLLGPSVPFLLDVTYEEKLDPVAAKPTPEECLARVHAIQSDTKITFGPGSTELDLDALRIVRRIASVLRDCDDVEMVIGGHTDSQGRAEMNKSLSQARADAVFNALIAEKVRATNLNAMGYGETDPIASNDSEDGREANRRIEFKLRYPLFGPPMPPTANDATSTAQDTESTDGQD